MLEQTTTFRPLVRKFIASSDVARRTGKHQIPWIVRTSFTSDWNNVIYMVGVFPFAKFHRAPVTFTFLRFQLTLNIFDCITTPYSPFSRFAGTRKGTHLYPAVFRLLIAQLFFSELFWVSTSTLAFLLISTLSIRSLPLYVISRKSLLFENFFLYTDSLIHFIPMLLPVLISGFPHVHRAVGCQAIFCTFVGIKKFFGGREKPVTFGATFLGYNITHGKNQPFFSSRQRVYPVPRWQTILLCLNYTINQPEKLVYGAEGGK